MKKALRKKALPVALALFLAAPSVTLAAPAGYETVVKWGVNFRSEPSTDGYKYRMIPKGEYIHVIQEVNSYWLQIQTQDGQIGYISADAKYTDYVSPSTVATGTITKGVNFRSSPKVADNKIGSISKGTKVQVLEITNQWWVKIQYNGKIGYVSSDYITVNGQIPGAPSSGSGGQQPGNPPQAENRADQIIAFAESLIGKVTYEYGVRNTSKLIFDCSSFTQYVFQQFGVDLKWGTKYQKSAGTAVSKANLKKGDLVFFATSGSSINHVGIYIENGKFIHNTPSKNGVTINDLNTGYWKDKYVSARRVL